MDKDTVLGQLIRLLVSVPTQMLGTLVKLVRKLSGNNGDQTHQMLKKMLRGKLVVKVTDKLLELNSKHRIPEIKKFSVADYFTAGKNNIGWIGENLEKWFIKPGIVEKDVEETELYQYTLKKCSVDSPIIKKLGGKTKAKIFLSQVAFLMENVSKRDGIICVFYAETTVFSKEEESLAYLNEKDEKVQLRAVYAYWRGDGWDVGASSVENTGGWDVGYGVFSRSSC